MARASKPKASKPSKTKQIVSAGLSVGASILRAQGVPIPESSKKKGSSPKRRQTVAKIKRKIALLKAKKELAKLRGY